MDSGNSTPPLGKRETEAEAEAGLSDGNDVSKIVYPSPTKQAFIITGLLLGIFLAGLDISIIATAIPAITAEFNSLADSGWYGSVFFLCYAAFQSVWGKAYKFFDMKWVFVAAIFFFEVGCLIGGLAPNSPALIIGRAVQGGGAAGILLGCYSITNFIAPPEKVPIIVGLIGTMFSIASVIGPLLGGVFTSGLTWRWVFYINLPIGAAPLAFIIFFFKTPEQAKVATKTPLRDILLSFDPAGTVLLLASLICYFMALGWGGTVLPWSSSTVIGLLVGWVLLTALFIGNEIWQGERALLVLRILKNRDIMLGCVYLFFLYGAYFAVVYNIPIYFQASFGLSPRDSGIRTIPIICSSSIVTFIASIAFGKIGKYSPFLLAGAAVSTVSGGLLYTLDVDSSLGRQIGYQILLGAGVGLVVQIPPIVAGMVTSNEDKAIGLGVVLVTQFYSAALTIAATSSITNNLLINSIQNIPSSSYSSSSSAAAAAASATSSLTAPAVTVADVLSVGAHDLQLHFQGPTLRAIRESYVVGLRGAWAMGIGLWALSFFVPLVLGKWPGRVSMTGAAAAAAAADVEGHGADEKGEKAAAKPSPALPLH